MALACAPSSSSGRGRDRGRRLAALTLVASALAVAGCGGGDGDDGTVQREVVTTDAGTVIVRSTTDREALEVEVQGDSVYVSFTKDTPTATRAALRGTPLGGRCRLADGREVGTIQLLWREDPGNWGSNLAVQGLYDGGDELPHEIRSCDLRRGGAAGPVVASVRFTDG